MITDAMGLGEFAAFLPSLPTGKEVARFHFTGPEDMANHVPDNRPAGAWADTAWMDREAFTGTKCMQDARALALGGWQEGAETVRRIAERIALQAPQRETWTRYDVAGATPNVQRWLAGNPVCMRRQERRASTRQPVITLIADAAASGATDKKQLALSAGIAAAAVDRLEAAGFRVEVLCVMRSNGPGGLSEIAWRGKAPEDAADPAKLAMALGHPSMLRRFGFAIWQTHRPCQRLLSESLGHPVTLASLPDRPAGTFILPSPMAMPSDELGAFRHALETLRKQGCPGIPEDLAA
jgi:hypothetical protein